ncbi:MAG TPA: hypothetical protein VHY91_26345 [Pirellulales bacterium]|nr:hypothetical protein [Pirellulales bacterium]
MSKLLAFAIAASMFGTAAATAQARCGGCSTHSAAASRSLAPSAASAGEHSKMETPMSKVPQSTRRISYGPVRAGFQPRWSWNLRDASSKVLGNY